MQPIVAEKSIAEIPGFIVFINLNSIVMDKNFSETSRNCVIRPASTDHIFKIDGGSLTFKGYRTDSTSSILSLTGIKVTGTDAQSSSDCTAYGTFSDGSNCTFVENGVTIFLDFAMGCLATPQDYNPDNLRYHTADAAVRMFMS